MASYRYERDIDPKDLQPRKQRQYTRKERWANWWDYNLKWVIIIGIIVVFFGYNFIGQYFFTVLADYNVVVGGHPDRPAGRPCRLRRRPERRWQGGGKAEPLHHGLWQRGLGCLP